MRRAFGGLALAALAALPAAAATAPRPAVADPGADVAEARVPAGKYYVGRVTGPRDYKLLANATTTGFLVMRGELTQGLFAALTAWGTLHGYVFGTPCQVCNRAHDEKPAAAITWRDAALLANALSELHGLDAVYRDAAGQPLRDSAAMDGAVVEPTLSGYRLPTIPEWQIAIRGADKALADGTYGEPGRSPNALGLVDTAGPLAEWTANSMDLGPVMDSHFACNEMADGATLPSTCSEHPTTWSDTAIAVRLVRRAPAARDRPEPPGR